MAGEKNSEPGLRDTGNMERTGNKHVQIVDWDGYLGIDRHEVTLGALKGKPREKLVDVRHMLGVAGESK